METARRTDIFQLPEILEAILLRVPPVTVQTTCRQVCQHWKVVIETTPALRYYTETGLWLPDREYNIERPLPEPFCAFTPMAIDMLQMYWRKLDAIAIKLHDNSNQDDTTPTYQLWTPVRMPLIQKIGELLAQFQPICQKIRLLRPGFSYIKYKKFTKNWIAYVYNSNGEVAAVRETIPETDPNPFFEILSQMGRCIWNTTKSESYDYNPDGIVPKHPDGEIKAYLLFIVDYKADTSELEMKEAERKDKEELLRQQDRKRIKKIIRERSRQLVRDGYGPLDDDTEEDAWEEEERIAHAAYEKKVGTKVFRELLRFGDYEPHRPVVVIRGTNYGYT
ncbi:hypothetical protein TWF281_006200 [Arthrobotrys megalospora]